MTPPATSSPIRSLAMTTIVTIALLLVVLLGATPFGTTASANVDADGASGIPGGQVLLYTSVTQDTVDAALAVLAEQQPDLDVRVFRAPTGELDARIATELRTGGLRADVLWMTDPLSIQRYESEGLLASLDAEAFSVVPSEYRGETFVGTRLLNLIIVAGQDLEATPRSWASLTDASLANAVALPDPGFAGSAFAALGYFATAEDLGMAFYRELRENGAIQVASPGEVLTGVAEGRYQAGITLDKVVRAAADKGSPVELIWPESGAIALYSPAAVVATSDDPGAAHALVEFLVSPDAQAAIASTGWQPIRDDVPWPFDGAAVSPDWQELFGSQQALLANYRAIFSD